MRPRQTNHADKTYQLACVLHEIDDLLRPWEALSADEQDRYLRMAHTARVWHATQRDSDPA